MNVMDCPKCYGGSMVIDSRYRPTMSLWHRRRHCTKCSFRWSTVEIERDRYTQLASYHVDNENEVILKQIAELVAKLK